MAVEGEVGPEVLEVGTDIIVRPDESLDSEDFEKLITESRALDLFYKPLKVAALELFSEVRESFDRDASSREVVFPGQEDHLIWQIINNPTASVEDKKQRQSVMDALVQLAHLPTLGEQKENAYGLIRDFTNLMDTAYGEKDRVEELFDRHHRRFHSEDKKPSFTNRQQEQRTRMSFLFGANKSYIKVRNAMSSLEGKKELTHVEIAKIAEGIGWEEWEYSEIFRKKEMWDTLQGLPEKKKLIIDFATKLTTFPEPALVKMGRSLLTEAGSMPEFGAIEVFKAWKSGDKEKLGVLENAVESITGHVQHIGALVSMATHIEAQGFGRAEFDPSMPEGFKKGWNFKNRKSQMDWRTDEITWEQTPNDSPGFSPVTLFNGSNMSGKSYNLQQILYMNLCAQGFGYVPAESGNFHHYDAFVHVDRSNTDSDNDLSAFGKEVDNWNKALEVIDEADAPCVFADETYSTTSPEDQYRLGVASISYLQDKGARIYWANHNEALNRFVGNWQDAQVYHFETGVGADGDIEFLYNMKPGLETSHSLEVAKKLNLPASLISDSARFIEGNPEPVKHVEPIQNVVLRYTPERREELKQAKSPIAGFFRGANEIVMHPGLKEEPELQDKKGSLVSRLFKRGEEVEEVPEEVEFFDKYRHPEMLKGPHLRWRYGRIKDTDGVMMSDGIHRMGEDYPKVAKQILETFTDDHSFGSRNFGMVGELIRSATPDSTEELIERQNLFRALDSLDCDFEKTSRLIYDFIRGTNLFFSGYGNMMGNSEGVGFDNFFRNMFERTIESYSERSWSDDWEKGGAMMRDLALALPEFLSVDEPLHSEGVRRIESFLSLGAIMDEKNPFEGAGKVEEFREWEADHRSRHEALAKEFQNDFDTEVYSQEFLKNSLQMITDSIPDHDFSDIDYAKVKTLMQPILEGFRVARDAGAISNGDWRMGCVLDLFFEDDYGYEELGETLRSKDSVHLHQWANYLEEVCSQAFSKEGRGEALFETLKGLENDEARFAHCKNLVPMYYSDMFRAEFSNLEKLKKVADWMRDEGFCDVEFTNDNDMRIEEGWNLLYEDKTHPFSERKPLHKTKSREQMLQVKNDSEFRGNQRVNLITGTNMSGKTFGMKKDVVAAAVALVTGRAPAKSMSMPFYDGVVYIDRVHTKKESGLSAFGQDCHTWRDLLARINKDQNLFVSVDEAFSTVSPRYQAALSYGAAKYMAENGSTLSLSSHNHQFVEAFLRLNSDFARAWHFDTEIGEDGGVNFKHQIKEGHEPSHAIAVARHLGMNESILKMAESLPA